MEQKAAIAAQELEDKLEEQKRIERNKMLARALIDEFSQGKPSPESLGRRVERVVTQFAETESKKRQRQSSTLFRSPFPLSAMGPNMRSVDSRRSTT